MRRLAALAATCVAAAALCADSSGVLAFSAMEPGPLRGEWHEVTLSRIKRAQFTIVRDEGASVLRVRAESAAGSAMHAVEGDSGAAPMLAWRWKVDRVVEKADLASKSGDDFAARVYVFYDLPLDELPFAERVRMRIARALYGPDVPAAAICYVWDNRHSVGTVAPNAFTDRVRMIVLESGPARVGTWVAERRDLERDYRDAFGIPRDARVPRVSAIGAGADTDQTDEQVTAWFGDFRLEARP